MKKPRQISPADAIRGCSVSELTDRMASVIPTPYPIDAALAAIQSVAIELIARRYNDNIDQQLKFMKLYNERMERNLNLREKVRLRTEVIRARLQKEGKPHGTNAILTEILHELKGEKDAEGRVIQ